jgi:hypothetical protein
MRFPLVSTADLLMWAAAETASIIIGASIPYLRKLLWRFFKKPRATNPHTKLSSGNQISRMDNTTVRLSNAPAQTNAYRVRVPIKGDDGSEKSIVGDSDSTNSGIMVSQQITIRVDAKDSTTSLARPGRW